jgi:hypothetical protein
MPFERLLEEAVPPLGMVMRQPTDTAAVVYTPGTTRCSSPADDTRTHKSGGG